MNDFGDLTGAAIVTGGSGGLGAAVARLLAARGSRVIVTYRNNEAAARAVVADVERDGGRAEVCPLDLLDSAAAAEAVNDTASRHGGVHTVVHAAGPMVRQLHLSRVAPDTFREHLEHEVMGFFNVVQPAIPHLRAAGGSIVAVTTAATRRHAARDGLSAAPKGAIEAAVRALAAEEGRFGVRANCVGPGFINDGMALRLQEAGDIDAAALDAAMRNIPLRRFGGAVDIAEAVCFLASPRAGYIRGQMLDVDGAYSV